MSNIKKPLIAADAQYDVSQQSSLLMIDPRARIITTLLFALAVVSSDQVIVLLCAFLLSVIATFFAKLTLLKTLKRLVVMDAFMLYLLIILPFTVEGDQLFSVFGLQGSWQGLEQAIIIALKANSVVLMLFSLVSNLSASALGSALQAMKISNKLIQLLLFTMRYLSVISEELQRLRRSMRARSFVMGFNLHSWQSIGNLIGMMLVRSMQRSERILKAMKCRGYNGQFISYHPMQWQQHDYWFCILMCTISFALIYLNLGSQH